MNEPTQIRAGMLVRWHCRLYVALGEECNGKLMLQPYLHDARIVVPASECQTTELRMIAPREEEYSPR